MPSELVWPAMADLPPPSDPQIARILEQDRARKKRLALVVARVVVVIGGGLGGSQVYFAAQAKKKRNVAYSRVIKCLLGSPPAAGEPPMMRIRAAWRARAFVEKNETLAHDQNELDARAVKLWPNRCVAEMVAFTDTLKENGDMKEGDKDLGYYSRELSKQSAGDNWKEIDPYQSSLEAFLAAAKDAKCEFVDVADVAPPEVLDADPIDKLVLKTNLTPLPFDTGSWHQSMIGGARRFYMPPQMGQPPQLCITNDGATLACAPPVKGGVPVDVVGAPTIFPADDAATTILSYGREGNYASVFRSDGVALTKRGEYFAIGGHSSADGRALLLLKAKDKPTGDTFTVGHLAAGASTLTFSDVKLDGWTEIATLVDLFGEQAVWVGESLQLMTRNVATVPPGPIQVIGTMPGMPSLWDGAPFHVCQTKNGPVFHTPVVVESGKPTTLLSFADVNGAFGKLQRVDAGNVVCGTDAVYVWSDFLATCRVDGCTNQPRTRAKPTEEGSARSDVTTVIDGTLVTVEWNSGLIRIIWSKDDKPISTRVWDGQIKGSVLLAESKTKVTHLFGGPGYALLVLRDGDGQDHGVRLDARGSAEPLKIAQN
ncbi:hypothetical protein BH09MYX1_BH09MYX1_27340 [soil metagenome]